MSERYCWIPESPSHPGLYAWRNYPDEPISSHGDRKQNSTMVAADALQFETRDECQAWCDAHPVPVFIPIEHGFA